MDWYRFMRAVEAEHMERIEERRELQVSGDIKSTDLTADEWAAIRRHDDILREYGD